MTYDVIATEIATGKVRTIATGKDEQNAAAIVNLAVLRRGVDVEFFMAIPTPPDPPTKREAKPSLGRL